MSLRGVPAGPSQAHSNRITVPVWRFWAAILRADALEQVGHVSAAVNTKSRRAILSVDDGARNSGRNQHKRARTPKPGNEVHWLSWLRTWLTARQDNTIVISSDSDQDPETSDTGHSGPRRVRARLTRDAGTVERQDVGVSEEVIFEVVDGVYVEVEKSAASHAGAGRLELVLGPDEASLTAIDPVLLGSSQPERANRTDDAAGPHGDDRVADLVVELQCKLAAEQKHTAELYKRLHEAGLLRRAIIAEKELQEVREQLALTCLKKAAVDASLAAVSSKLEDVEKTGVLSPVDMGPGTGAASSNGSGSAGIPWARTSSHAARPVTSNADGPDGVEPYDPTWAKEITWGEEVAEDELAPSDDDDGDALPDGFVPAAAAPDDPADPDYEPSDEDDAVAAAAADDDDEDDSDGEDPWDSEDAILPVAQWPVAAYHRHGQFNNGDPIPLREPRTRFNRWAIVRDLEPRIPQKIVNLLTGGRDELSWDVQYARLRQLNNAGVGDEEDRLEAKVVRACRRARMRRLFEHLPRLAAAFAFDRGEHDVVNAAPLTPEQLDLLTGDEEELLLTTRSNAQCRIIGPLEQCLRKQLNMMSMAPGSNEPWLREMAGGCKICFGKIRRSLISIDQPTPTLATAPAVAPASDWV
ncbi:hypothetical protein AURDEDRAFT_128759 [Auricularia subglabra TFB-10046 SS5]|nr:hypothetical protein AURDEDRAFT_128759 [Auricularia subglabra TFB-10046 SS5]